MANSKGCVSPMCDKPMVAKGWCAGHWRRASRGLDPMTPLRRRVIGGTCSVEGCERRYLANGWCDGHLKRVLAHGEPGGAELLRFERGTLEQRILRRVDMSGGPDVCWPFDGATTPGGYGRIGMGSGVVRQAHRVAYEQLIGPIPEGLHLDHLCRNPVCCNPSHLEPVTPSENTKRMHAAARVEAYA